MKCPNCKKKIEKGKKFCGYCGAAIPEKAKRKVDKRILIPAGVAGVCGVALLGTVILTNPQQTSASKLEKKIAAGNRYLQSADYEKAEVAFNEALSIDKKSSDAALGLAKVCNEKKDPEGALSYLKLANENLERSLKSKEDILTFLIHLGYLAYNPIRKTVYIPNEEIRQEFVNATADRGWSELQQFENESSSLLEVTLDMDTQAVADKIETIHMQYVSTLEYNDENSLSSVLSIAYLSSMRYYFRPVRELPTGRGYADYVYIPKSEYIGVYPAMLVELKWNKSAETALNQIKEKRYPESLLQYTGEILLVGINYDKKTKCHECKIEEYKKEV